MDHKQGQLQEIRKLTFRPDQNPGDPHPHAWLDRHPRWTLHFTPTSASWINAVDGFFAKLARRRLRRGVIESLVEVQAAIKRYIAESNGDPKPFVWTADQDRIIRATKRGHLALDSHD